MKLVDKSNPSTEVFTSEALEFTITLPPIVYGKQLAI